MFFLYRRLIFAILINFDDQYTFLQLTPFTLTGLAIIAYQVCWMPMDSKMFNGLAIFNECILVFMGFQMYNFTDYIPNPERRYDLGKYFLGLVYFNIAVNLFVLGIDIIVRIIKAAKK